MARVNADLIGKFVNIASRAAGFISKRFGGRLGEIAPDGGAAEHLRDAVPHSPSCTPSAKPPRWCARSWRCATA
jgi:methionyl-tRNA synthetase